MARGFSYAPGASAEVDEAGAPELTKERLQALGASRNALVREAVARRADCPFGLMVTLAHDHAAPVRAAMAGNPRVLHSILEYLSHDRSVEVMCAVASNPATTPDIIEALAVHRKSEVRAAAAAALESRAAGGGTADARMPELRDRVFEESEARREAMLAQAAEQSLAAAADAAMAAAEPPLEPAEPLPARPTRTAPVRGFRPPVDV
ncbi:hypothetical protein [Demequina soli]|uniref:hypothetical protein n=1 Tax=Demequina soli TaxID=1638987 RepID=UPI000780AA03|nr:hypothetical protein [Demequina soli]